MSNPPLLESLQKQLSKTLESSGISLLNVASISMQTDRLERFRTLHEILEQFETQQSGGRAYILYLKEPAGIDEGPVLDATQLSQTKTQDGVYLPSGKLNANFLLENAELLLRAQDYEHAKGIYKSLIQSGEELALSYFGLALSEQGLGKIENALKACEESALYHPRLEVYRQWIQLLLPDKPQKAAEVLDHALHLKNLTKELTLDLLLQSSELSLQLGLFTKAERCLFKARELAPQSADALYLMGQLFQKKNLHPEALDCYYEGLQLNAGDPRFLKGASFSHHALGQKEEALKTAAESLKADPKQTSLLLHLIRIGYELKNYVETLQVVEKCVLHQAYDSNLWFSLAGLYIHVGKRDLALQRLRMILERDPSHREASLLLSKMRK